MTTKRTITKAEAMKLSLRFNRGNQNAAISAAVKGAVVYGVSQYVLPTAFGFKVEATRPAFGRFFRVDWQDDVATVELVEG